MASNVPFENRGARADEFVQALTRIWTEDVVEFKGRYYNIPASKIWTKTNSKATYSNLFGRVHSEDIFKDCKICGWVATNCIRFFRLYYKRHQDTERERKEGEQTSRNYYTESFPK